MFKSFKKVTPIFIAVLVTGVYSNSAQAQVETNKTLNQIEQYSTEGKEDSINQITNVNQLRDVSPTDWSYEALRGLTERYGCVSGLPDGTYQGDRPITRNEFAAGLNSCFQQIERSINSPRKQSYLDSIQSYLDSTFRIGFPRRIVEKNGSISTFNGTERNLESEFATLEYKTDDLESRTIKLEDNQFSPTTKLTGETIFNVSDSF